MTDRLDRLLGQGRLVFVLVAVFVLAGIAAFLQMDRQEDPSFPYRAGLITVPFPGAAPDRIERLVLDPLEEQLAEVEQVELMKSTVRQGVALAIVQFSGSVYDTDAAWDRIRVAMEQAAIEYPDGVGTARLDDRMIDTSTVLLAITGDADPRRLADAARKVRTRMLGVDGVASTQLYGDPGKQVTVAMDDAAISRNGLSPGMIAGDIRANNRVSAGGSIRLAGASVNLKPSTDFESLDDVRATAIGLPGGGTVPLAALANVHESARTPPRDQLWYDGARAVAVEVVAARDSINVVAFGKKVRAAVDEVRAQVAPLEIREMFYQPAQTEQRLSNLTQSLILSIAIILGVLFVFMGWRMAVVVALLLPLVTLTAIALYAFGGGVLQQMAVIGLVVALGILVDNAIVMTENVQWHLNDDIPPGVAASRSVHELAGPLFAATGTTLAAFVPMLLAEGNSADFIRALPITIMLSLAVSYVFAVTVTPMISRHVLKPQTQKHHDPIQSLANTLAKATTRHPVAWLALGIVAVVAAGACMRFVDQEFFPQADRAVVIVDITLPEGTHLSTTQAAARTLEQALRGQPGVQAIHGFIGTGGPKFYYNLQRSPQAPQRARLAILTDGLAHNAAIIKMIERYSNNHLPAADVVASVLSQGPPTKAPIELRVFNDDPEKLVRATEQIFNTALSIPGARDVRHDLGTGVPSIDYQILPSVARSYGVTPVDVAQALQGRSQGLTVGQYRAGEDPVPIMLRSPEGERSSPTALQTINVYNDSGEHVPLMQVATTKLAIQPGAIRHHNQRRVAHVYSELEAGQVYSEVLNPLKARVDALELPPGTDIEYGGDAEESGKANGALFTTAPLGLALLLFFLLLQFNSFTRMGLVLLTAPFALVGVVPGLLLLNIPFGFQPMLGLFALTGIVVNNAIVLIDVIDQRLAEGEPLVEAIADAVRRRTRPIILTTATTIAGLLPLAFSDTTLWPPLAWPIITGLLASTVLTLLVLPAICSLVLKPHRHAATAAVFTGIVAIGLTGGWSAPAVAAPQASNAGIERNLKLSHWPATKKLSAATATRAAPVSRTRIVTFGQSVRLGQQRARVEADRFQSQAAGAAADRAVRAGRYPTLSARAYVSRSDTVGKINSEDAADALDGFGAVPEFSIPVGDRDKRGATIELRQPVVDAAAQLYGGPAAEQSANAASATLDRTRAESAVDAAKAYLDALSLHARIDAQQALIRNLDANLDKIEAARDSGRALDSDVLEVRFSQRQARQQRVSLQQKYTVAQTALARALGIAGRVQPSGLGFAPPVVTTDIDTLVARAVSQRRDLAALDARIRAAGLKIKQVAAQRLPTLDAVASLQYNEGNAFLPDREGRIAAELTWRPFAGGTISARASEARAQVEVLRAQRVEQRHGVRLEIQQALSDLRDAREREQLATLGIESARATRDTRVARLDAGRANIDEVLDAEATFANRRSQAQIARHDLVAAWVRLQGALGNSGWVDRIGS